MPVAIDKGILAPSRAVGATAKYPWRAMEIGDSFVFPDDVRNPSNYAGQASRNYAPKKFLSRTVTEDGKTVIRVWRIA